MAELDVIKKALGCFAGNGNVPDDCPCCFKNINGADCERNVATFTLELIESQEQTIKNLLKEKRPTGQWDYGTQCSVCKGTIIPPKDRKVHINFCPWCGADMRGGYDE